MRILLNVSFLVVFMNRPTSAINNDENASTRLLGELVHTIISRDFSDTHCIAVITEQNPDIVDHIPKNVLKYHFQIGGNNSPVPHVEDSVTYDYRTLNDNTKTFESFLIESLDAGCPLYVIQVWNPKAVIRCFSRSSRRAMFRLSRFYIFLPVIKRAREIKVNERELFAMKDMNFLPDLVVCRIVRNQAKADTNSTSLRGMAYFTSKADDITNHFNSLYMNECGGGNTHITRNKNATNEENLVEIRTHKFVGKNKSENILLDVWVAGNRTCSGRFLRSGQIFPDKMRNVEGRNIIMATWEYPPYVIINWKTKPPLLDGIDFRIALEFLKFINGSLRLTADPFWYWGEFFENGTGNGVMGFVGMDKADIGFMAFYSFLKAFQFCDFSTTHMRSSVTMLTARPKLKPAWMVPLMPFDGTMWGAVSACLVGCMYALYALQNFVDKVLGRPEDRVSPYSQLDYSVLRTYGMLLNQGPVFSWDPSVPRHVPARHFVGWFQFMGEVISDTYNAGLASVLSSPRYEPPIETLEDLADRKIIWAGDHMSWLWFIEKPDNPVIEAIKNNFRLRAIEDMTEFGKRSGEIAFPIEKLQGGHFATEGHVNEESVMKRRIMKDTLYWSHLQFFLRKGSPYKRYFDIVVTRLRETGLPLYWEAQVIRQRMSNRLQLQISTSRILQDDTGPLKLSLNQLQGAFFFLVLGYIAGLFAFSFELGSARRKNKNGNTGTS